MWRLANLGRLLPILTLAFCSVFSVACETQDVDRPGCNEDSHDCDARPCGELEAGCEGQ